VFPDSYRALKETAVIGAIAERSAIGVAGTDRASFLQGLLTNDVQALTAGTGCYAAWLTPQGRMITDLHVFESGDMMLLDVPAGLAQATLQRLDQFLFTEDVQVADLSATLKSVWVHGPGAASILERVLTGTSAAAPTSDAARTFMVRDWAEYQNARAECAGSPAVVARVSQLGVPGFCIYVEPARAAALVEALKAAGATTAEPATIEAARIEAGYPLWGVDMTDDTIPLEAGIEDRAISMSKGCYVGQEVIIRVLHRGHGRVARKLVTLRADAGVGAGDKIRAGDREMGVVTSAARSPRFGPIAMGYVHRDFVAAGTRVEIERPDGRVAASVSERPIPSAA
jgi:folate-binding protein YgfZ